MKRNSIIAIIIAAIAVLVASCSQVSPETQGRIPVSIKASIGAPTKTSYETLEGKIKTEWSANDTVSVITVQHTAAGDVITAVDNLVNTAGDGPAAVFEGTLTAVEGEISRYVMYPCMKYGVDYFGESRYTHKVFDHPNDMDNFFHFTSWVPEEDYIMIHSNRAYSSNDFYYVEQTDIMTGVMYEEADGSYSSVLKKQMAMHALEVTLPDGFIHDFFESLGGYLAQHDNIYFEVKLPGNKFSDGMFYEEHAHFNENGDLEFDIVTPYPEDEYEMFFPNESIIFNINDPEELPSSFTLYRTMLGGAEIKAGTSISVTLNDDYTEGPLLEKKLLVKTDQYLEPGHIYTYRADFR